MSPEPRDTSIPSPPPLAIPADFERRLAGIGVALDPAIIAQFADFFARMLAVNERMNLTAVTELEAVWTRHALDSCTLLPMLAALPAGARVLDLGSGGGVPGVLLAIARPDLVFTLVEATQKKATFLRGVSDSLELKNITVLPERVEKLTPDEHDALTARAVAKVAELVPWCAPMVRRGGLMLFIKGERAEAELADARSVIKRLGCRYVRTVITPTGRVVVVQR